MRLTFSSSSSAYLFHWDEDKMSVDKTDAERGKAVHGAVDGGLGKQAAMQIIRSICRD